MVVTGQEEERQYGLGLAMSTVKDCRNVQDKMVKEMALVWDLVVNAQDKMVNVMVVVWDPVVDVQRKMGEMVVVWGPVIDMQGERTKVVVDRRTKEQLYEEDTRTKGYVKMKKDVTRELNNVKNEKSEGRDELM